MYVITKNKVITINRGDYASFMINLTIGKFPNEKVYPLKEGDILFFGLMEPNQHFENAFLKKELHYDDYDVEGGMLKLVLNPEDTIELVPGVYFYQIKLLREDSDGEVIVDTVIQKTRFNIVD